MICKMDSVPTGDLMRQNITSQFPCLFPVNPQMYKKLDRLQTFKNQTYGPTTFLLPQLKKLSHNFGRQHSILS